MNDNNACKQFDLKGKNLKLVIVIVMIFIFLLGGTFAYFAYSGTNSIFSGNMGKVDLTLTVTKVLPDTDGVDNILVINFNELAASLNNDCYDEDGEFALCQLYRINLVNASGSINTNVKGSIFFNNARVPNLSWILLGNTYSSSTNYTSSQLGQTFNTASSSFVSFVDEYLLYSGSSVDYYILVWVNETEDEQTDEGIFSGIVKFEDANGNGVTAEFGS